SLLRACRSWGLLPVAAGSILASLPFPTRSVGARRAASHPNLRSSPFVGQPVVDAPSYAECPTSIRHPCSSSDRGRRRTPVRLPPPRVPPSPAPPRPPITRPCFAPPACWYCALPDRHSHHAAGTRRLPTTAASPGVNTRPRWPALQVEQLHEAVDQVRIEQFA